MTSSFLRCAGLLLCLTAPAAATDFYINAATGQDLPSRGTAAAPWKTIQYAIQQSYSQSAAGSHTYYLAAGTYSELVHFNYTHAAGFVASFVGASRSTVSVDGFTMQRLMRGISVSNLSCKTVVYDSYRGYGAKTGSLRVSNCRVTVLIKHSTTESTPPSPTVILGSQVEKIEFSFPSDAAVDAEITDCIIGAGGIHGLGGHQPCRVKRCYITGPARFQMFEGSLLELSDCVFAGGGLYISAGDPASSTARITNCVIADVAGPGLEFKTTYLDPSVRFEIYLTDTVIFGCTDGILAKVDECDLDLLRCLISDNRGSGIHLTSLDYGRLTVRQSVISRNADHGILVQNAGAAFYSRLNVIESSILAHNRNGMEILGTPTNTSSFKVLGCTIVDNSLSGISKSNIPDSRAEVLHSILIGPKPLGISPWPVHYCLNDLSLLPGSNNLRADPRFLSRSLGNYRLAPPSPAIDAGLAGTGGSDFEGDARYIACGPGDAHHDIGADEYSAAGLAHPFGAAASAPGMPQMTLTASAPMKIGQSLTLTALGPRPTDVVLWLADMHEGPTLTLYPGIPIYLNNPDWIILAARNPTGAAIMSAPIPNDPNLIGAGLLVQALAGSPGALAVSPLLRFVIGG